VGSGWRVIFFLERRDLGADPPFGGDEASLLSRV